MGTSVGHPTTTLLGSRLSRERSGLGEKGKHTSSFTGNMFHAKKNIWGGIEAICPVIHVWLPEAVWQERVGVGADLLLGTENVMGEKKSGSLTPVSPGHWHGDWATPIAVLFSPAAMHTLTHYNLALPSASPPPRNERLGMQSITPGSGA